MTMFFSESDDDHRSACTCHDSPLRDSCPRKALTARQIVQWLLFDLGVNAYQRVDAGWKLCLKSSAV